MVPNLPLPPDIDNRIATLSARERACLERAAARVPHKTIAYELQVGSIGTIDGYLSTGARKLGLSRRDALRLFAERVRPGNPGSGFPGLVDDGGHSATEGQPRFSWPFPTRTRPNNDLTPIQTRVAILIAAALLLAGLALLMLATKIVSQPG